MAERLTPNDLVELLNRQERRLRALERRPFPKQGANFIGTDCLSILGKGSQDEPFLIDLRIDPDTTNQLGCLDNGLFVGGGQVVGWDAVVDGSIVNSDPDRRLFKGIGEALGYLVNTVGLTSAGVAVRNGTYTETANWSSPAAYRLFGVRSGVERNSVGDLNQPNVEWDWNGFRPTVIADAQMDGIYFRPGTVGAGGISPAFNSLTTTNCYFNMSSMPVSPFRFCNWFHGINSQFDFVHTNGSRIWAGGHAYFLGCDLDFRPILSATPTMTLVNGAAGVSTRHLLVMRGGRLATGTQTGPYTVTLPAQFDIDQMSESHVGNSFRPGLLTVPAGARGSIRLTRGRSSTGDEAWSVSATSGFDNLALYGDFHDLTLTSTHDSLLVYASIWGHGIVDITGPAIVDLETKNSASKFIFRGGAINGRLAASNTIISSGALVTGITAGASNLHVVAGGAGVTGTGQPYNLDAASVHNFILWPNLVSWANPGTDAGSNNRIETT